MRLTSSIVLISFFAFLLSCGGPSSIVSKEDHFDVDRPHNPWVFRSVLDSQARMVTLALNENMWAAYNTNDCSIYKVWKGHVHFDGAVYTTVHGPQPTTIGDSYMEPQNQNWLIRENGNISKVAAQYNGHEFKNGKAYLNYTLTDDQGRSINVKESPDYYENAQGQAGFVRNYTTSNVPPGVEVILQTTISSIALESGLSTDGTFEKSNSVPLLVGDINGLSIDGNLVLNSNATTEAKAIFTKQPLIPNTRKKAEAAMIDIPEGARLINRSDCKTCHNTYRKTVGPAYIEVARKYFNTTDNVAMLTGKVKNGGAGVWGQAAMTPHPDLADSVITKMITYIMDLDAEEEKEQMAIINAAVDPDLEYIDGESDGFKENLEPGLRVRYFKLEKDAEGLSSFDWEGDALAELNIPNISVMDEDLAAAGENFGLLVEGYIKIPKDNNYVFRLISDDGSAMYLNDELIIDNGGFHGSEAKDGEVALKKGYHKVKVKYFQGYGGKNLQLQWKSFSDEGGFKVIPASQFSHHKTDQASVDTGVALRLDKAAQIPGDQYPLQDVHPSFVVKQARPETFLPKVGGLDFLADGRMVVSTWDPAGTVYIVSNHASGDPSNITVKTIAKGLAEPLGLKVVDNEIYVLQKQELTHLVDHNGDDLIDEYRTVSNDWLTSGNFHEFAFGLEYRDGYFYATLATAIQPGGASTTPQITDRGKVAKISLAEGTVEFIAHGLRTPNGIGVGVDNELFVADNQGDWLPASKIVHVQEGAWYGSRSVDFSGTGALKETLPVVWLPQDEIGNSPSTPTYLDKGIYKGQMIHGEVTHGGVKRVFVEKINGQYQGCVFRFIQGLESGVNRLRWSPDGALYIGGIGSTGNWGHTGKLWWGLQRLEFDDSNPAFEMLAVRAKTNGMEIEFTQPLKDGEGWDPNDYEVMQWRYQPTENYGGPKIDETRMVVKSASVSDGGKKVFLELDGLKEGYEIVYIRLKNTMESASGQGLWTTEAWYTMNSLPKDEMGSVLTSNENTLTDEEIAAGWQLLFDGKTTTGWKNYGKSTIGADWKVSGGSLMLDVSQGENRDGGDIVTVDDFQNYELSLEWKVGKCGNSGIMYNVIDDGSFDYSFETGPEMQILDNECHPDAKIVTHRAGDLYDMISSRSETVHPAEQWNHVRIIIDNGHLEHWLNGEKVVETEMFTPEWAEMIAKSKFKDMKGFGLSKSGKIALQDHSDPIAFRNIKIREIKPTM